MFFASPKFVVSWLTMDKTETDTEFGKHKEHRSICAFFAVPLSPTTLFSKIKVVNPRINPCAARKRGFASGGLPLHQEVFRKVHRRNLLGQESRQGGASIHMFKVGRLANQASATQTMRIVATAGKIVLMT